MRKEKKLDVKYTSKISLPSKWTLFFGVNINFKKIFPSFYHISYLFLQQKKT